MNLAVGPAAYATVSINWFTFENVNESLLDGGGLLPTNSIWQLIWSPDAAIDLIDQSDPLTPQGSEILLLEFRNTTAGRNFTSTASYDATDPMYGLAEDDFVGGYVYSRIFNYQGVGTPGVGTWFYEGLSTPDGPLDDIDPGPGSTTLHDPTGGVAINLNQQILVPEPHSLLLFALGAVVVWIRHRRR